MNEKTKAIISAIVVLIANLAALWGVSIDQGVWVNGLCAIVMLISSIWAIWKNHNFTQEAAEAQRQEDLPERPVPAEAQIVLNDLKAAKHAKDEETENNG